MLKADGRTYREKVEGLGYPSAYASLVIWCDGVRLLLLEMADALDQRQIDRKSRGGTNAEQ